MSNKMIFVTRHKPCDTDSTFVAMSAEYIKEVMPRIGSSAHLVLSFLAEFERTNGNVRASTRFIEKGTRLNRKTVMKALSILRTYDLVETDGIDHKLKVHDYSSYASFLKGMDASSHSSGVKNTPEKRCKKYTTSRSKKWTTLVQKTDQSKEEPKGLRPLGKEERGKEGGIASRSATLSPVASLRLVDKEEADRAFLAEVCSLYEQEHNAAIHLRSPIVTRSWWISEKELPISYLGRFYLRGHEQLFCRYHLLVACSIIRKAQKQLYPSLPVTLPSTMADVHHLGDLLADIFSINPNAKDWEEWSYGWREAFSSFVYWALDNRNFSYNWLGSFMGDWVDWLKKNDQKLTGM